MTDEWSRMDRYKRWRVSHPENGCVAPSWSVSVNGDLTPCDTCGAKLREVLETAPGPNGPWSAYDG